MAVSQNQVNIFLVQIYYRGILQLSGLAVDSGIAAAHHSA
jgi:hypothetical protein